MMQKSNGADNPQVTLTKEDLGWLGGCLDSDGCLSIARRNRKGTTAYQYSVHIVLCNSDPNYIEEIARLLKLARIGHWVKNRGFSGKTAGQIQISGIKRVNRALSILAPYVRSKRAQAQALLEFTGRRMAIYPAKKSYDPEDDEFYRRNKELNKGTSETIRGERLESARYSPNPVATQGGRQK
jgi:hypothetical protein